MLRGRDPVYRTLRELAMSYFHEYVNKRGQKTLREYSRPYDLRALDPALWVSGERDVWELVERLDAHPHTRLRITSYNVCYTKLLRSWRW